MTKHDEAMSELDYLVRSNRPLIYVVSYEETRVMEAIRTVATSQSAKTWNLLSWDLADGLRHECGPTEPTADSPRDQISVLEWFASATMPEDTFSVLVLKDFQHLIGDSGHVGQVELRLWRMLRNMCASFVGRRKCVIILAAGLFLPEELERIVSVIDWPLPEVEHIRQWITQMLSDATEHPELSAKFRTKYEEQELGEIVGAFRGMTNDQIVLLSTYIMLKHGEFSPGIVSNHKRDMIRKSTILEWIEPEEGLEAIGGLNSLKAWIENRKALFGPEARQHHIRPPKGLLLFGVQGCGKSKVIKCLARDFGLPILRLDMGRIFQGLVGGSEQNVRNAIKIAESVAPCVLWSDEIEKGIAGHRGSGTSDGGTAARVFSTFLTWMQEKTAPVFFVATANDISVLPPEFMRKGRFDEIFFVDLPLPAEREQIISIHAKTRGFEVTDRDMVDIVASSERFTGAEIEAAIEESLVVAFNDNKRTVTAGDIIEAMERTTPLAMMMSEQIDALRDWASLKARQASERVR